jgi:hypothetical protein
MPPELFGTRHIVTSCEFPTPTVLDEPATPYGVPCQRLQWTHDSSAKLYFVIRPGSAYILGIERGAQLSGTDILRAFQPIAAPLRVKVVGVTFDTIGFWEKMVERQLVSDWCLDEPNTLLG